MTMISAAQHRVCDAFPQLLDGLRSEFGCQDVETLGERFLAAEAVDFHWQSRVAERHLGQFFSLDDGDNELDRVLIFGLLAGRWVVACVIVDGDGEAVDMIGKRGFASYGEAAEAFEQAG